MHQVSSSTLNTGRFVFGYAGEGASVVVAVGPPAAPDHDAAQHIADVDVDEATVEALPGLAIGIQLATDHLEPPPAADGPH